MDLSAILAVVLPDVGTSAGGLGFVYKIGRKGGSMETNLKTSTDNLSLRCDKLAKELSKSNGQFSGVGTKLGEVGQRLAHIEGKLGIKTNPGEEG